MTKMDFIESFRFYRENYQHTSSLDDGDHHFFYGLVRLICFFSLYSGFSFFLQRVLAIKYSRKIFDAPIVYFVFTRNHEIVRKYMEDYKICYPACDFSFGQTIGTQKGDFTIHRFSLFLGALANARSYLDVISYDTNDIVIQRNKWKVFKLVGYEVLFEHLLKRVEVVIKFNDHIANSMLLHKKARYMGIKTVYVQHAPVSSRFPALHHDLNVLFSEDSKRKYCNSNPPKEIFTFFDIRFKEVKGYLKKRKSGKNKVLLATNMLDDMQRIEELLNALSLSYKVLLRPHPRDERNFTRFENDRVKLSKNRTIWEDLNHVEIVICNESAVALEAIFYGRLFYKGAFLSKSSDTYDFINTGLIKLEFDSIPRLMEAIDQRQNCSDITKLKGYIGDIDNQVYLAQELQKKINQLAESIV